MLAMLVDDTGEEQRQDCSQDQAGNPRQNLHQPGRQFADHQLAQHRTDVVDHHIGSQQAAAIAGGAAAHQAALHHHPDHCTADAGNETPYHPAPETHHQPHPDTASGKKQRGDVVAAVKTEAFDQATAEQRAQQVTGEKSGANHTYLPRRQVFMGEPKRHERI